jgi:hypothetical protein
MKGVGALLGDAVKASWSAWAKARVREIIQQRKNEVKK